MVHSLTVSIRVRGALNIRGAAIVRHLPKVGVPIVPSEHVLSGSDKTAIAAFLAQDALDFVITGDLDEPRDIAALRDYLDSHGAVHTKIIGTLQSARSLLNFGIVAQLVDAVILERGALGLHVLPEKMAVIQKRVIQICNLIGKPSIVTCILDSMQVGPTHQ